MKDETLYSAIIGRHSVRRFQKKSFGKKQLAEVAGIIAGVRSIVPENRFEVLIKNRKQNEDIGNLLGAYGSLISPPHYLVPYSIGENYSLIDLGFRVQQIAVRLWEIKVGSCFIGCLKRERKIKERLGLQQNSMIAAFLVFGFPSEGLTGRIMNDWVRNVYGGGNRKPFNEIFFLQSFEDPASPPSELKQLMDAARFAPSAMNAQPWRFLWRNNQLYLFVKNKRKGDSLALVTNYALHDGGICMANVSLAMDALGKKGFWELAIGMEEVPSHPAHLTMIAKLCFE